MVSIFLEAFLFEIDVKKKDTSFRIFAVGGSTTYGSASNNNETWPGHLERLLSKITSGFYLYHYYLLPILFDNFLQPYSIEPKPI